jgi:uncharacterized membrane protein YqiK
MTGFLIVSIFAAGFLLMVLLMGIAKFYRKVEQGKALIVNRMKREPEVTFTGTYVLPIIHKAEVMDISVKTLEIDRRGKDGLICKDNIRADIKVTFFVRVNKARDDVIKVAQSIGCQRASDPVTLEELFSAKFSEALKTVGKQLDFEDLYTKRDEFRDQIVQLIGRDLNGYVLEDAAIDYLEQTPLLSLDANNILDAQGIRKITELTTIQHVRTNEFQNNERKQIRKQDVEAAEAILELDRQHADAQAKQKREIETVQARETAETEKVRAEERLKSENARIAADEEIAINEENKQRQVAVAAKNRERVIAIESERVEKGRALEQIARERETELQRIEKDKEVEVQKREIANVIRERIAVDKTVAEEEERIKRLRVVEEAERLKDAAVIQAAGEAEELLIKDIKAAEAAEKASTHRAKEQITLADAELEAADRQARAKIRIAEGVQAEQAASGLAEVKVKEADAIAVEKMGRAEAAALKDKGEATASVVRVTGLSEAEAHREKLLAESVGLTAKAEAMKALDDASRNHEEFRLGLENERILGLESISARREVAHASAKVLSEALSGAKIDIVGGESMFVDRLVSAVSMGKAVDGFVDRSDRTQALLREYLDGDRSLPGEIREALSGLSTDAVQNLTLSALLARMIAKGDGDKPALEKLLDAARNMGIADKKS